MQKILWEGDTAHGHYQVVDGMYNGRPARVLYSGDHQAAQSGVAQDENPDLLFDYNQRLLELIGSLKPEHLLLVGGGAYTLPTALLRAVPHLQIDVVEPDPGLTELAIRFFGAPVDSRLTTFNTDGRSFLRQHNSLYDMIVIDAFIHTTIPKDLITLQAFTAYHAHLRQQGILAMNVISGYDGSRSQTLKDIYAATVQTFGTVDIFLASRGYSLWLPQNFVLTAQKGQDLPLREYVRYEAVRPPEVLPEMARED